MTIPTYEQLQQENAELKLEPITRACELQVMSEEKAELKSQLEALQAHVERLRGAVEEYCISQVGLYGDAPSILDDALDETPPQSLNHIEARVEEETIDRCAVTSWNHFMEICTRKKVPHGDYDDFCSAGSVRNTTRKYAKQEKG